MTEWEEFMFHREGACQPAECSICQIEYLIWEAYSKDNSTKNEGEQNG